MRREDLLDAFGDLDEELLASADEKPRSRPRSLARIGIVGGGVLAAAFALFFLIPGVLSLFHAPKDAAPDNSMAGGEMVFSYVFITDEEGSVRIEDAARVDAILAAIEDAKASAPARELATPPLADAEDWELAHGEYRIFLYTGDRTGGEYRLTEDWLYALGEGVVYFPTEEALTDLRRLLTE